MAETYKHLLVAVDGSEQANDALKETVRIAERTQATLDVLTVSDLHLFASDARVLEYLLAEEEVSAKNILTNARAFVPEGITSTFTKISGNVKGSIIDFAKQQQTDLIIIGATGKDALTRALIGSTTTYVVNHASCNVLVVK